MPLIQRPTNVNIKNSRIVYHKIYVNTIILCKKKKITSTFTI